MDTKPFPAKTKEKTMSNMNPEEVAALNEFGEVDAWANYFLCAPPEFARPFRLEVKRIGSIWVTMIPALDSAFFNRILGLGVGEPATEVMLDEAIAVLQKAGCQNYMAQVSPFAQPAEIPEWLAVRALKPSRNWAKVYRGNQAAPVIPTNLRVEKVGKEQADAFADVVLPAFEMPPALCPLVKPVAAAAMYVKGEVGWLGFGSTLKKYRKRGGQGAMFTRRIQDGLALGCKWFVTETGEDIPEDPNPSYHNMLRSGFQLAYLRRNYVHLAPLGAMREARRAVLVLAYSLKYMWERMGRR
jgi:hypothetical protein